MLLLPCLNKQRSDVNDRHAGVTLVCCIVLPAPSTIAVLQAEPRVVSGVGAGKDVCARLSLCIGFLTDKGRSAPVPESTKAQKQAHSCTTRMLGHKKDCAKCSSKALQHHMLTTTMAA